MANWTAQTTANATTDQLLDVLTRPDEIRRWSPIDFDLEDCDGRLAAGTRTRVTGRLAGVPVGFDVEVHAADQDGLWLSADGPIGIDVRYELSPASAGAELNGVGLAAERTWPDRPARCQGHRGPAFRRRSRQHGRPDRARGRSVITRSHKGSSGGLYVEP